MKFGLFGGALAKSTSGGEMGQGFQDYIEFNVEAEALGYHSTFLVEHHFTGWTQVSATLNLLKQDGDTQTLANPQIRAKNREKANIHIGERVVNNLPPAERDIAMVFQSYALYPHKTVAANMAFALKQRKTDPATIKRIEELFSSFRPHLTSTRFTRSR